MTSWSGSQGTALRWHLAPGEKLGKSNISICELSRASSPRSYPGAAQTANTLPAADPARIYTSNILHLLHPCGTWGHGVLLPLPNPLRPGQNETSGLDGWQGIEASTLGDFNHPPAMDFHPGEDASGTTGMRPSQESLPAPPISPFLCPAPQATNETPARVIISGNAHKKTLQRQNPRAQRVSLPSCCWITSGEQELKRRK